MSSTCFETEGLSSGRRMYVQVWYGTFYMHQYKQSCWWEMVGSLGGGRWWVALEVEEGGQPSTYKTTHLLPPTKLLILMHIKHTIPVCTSVFLKINPRVRNM